MKNKRPSPESVVTRVVEMNNYGYSDNMSYITTYKTVTVRNRTYLGTTTPNFVNLKCLPFNSFSLQLSYVTPSLLRQGDSYTYNGNAHPSIAGKTYIREFQVYWATGQSLGSIAGHIAGVEAKCSQRLQAEFAGIKVNLGQFVAERTQVIDMVAKTAGRLVHAARSLKKLRLGDAMQALALGKPTRQEEAAFWARLHSGSTGKQFPKKKSKYKKPNKALKPEQVLSSAWLELQYGWQPLLQDVFNAAELLADKVRRDEFNNVVSASATESESNPWYYYNYLGLGAFGNHKIGIATRKTTCKYKAFYKVTNEFKTALAVTGISNPAVLAWELVPFSFVVDWFLPVGNFLEQLTAYNGFEFSSVHRVLFSRGNLDVSGSFGTASSSDYSGSGSGVRCQVAGTAMNITYERGSLPTPAFVPLTLKSPVSPTHALNSIALLVSAFGK